MKRGADEFTKSMEAANARILAFGASMAIINGVSDAFKGMVRNMVEVEKSLADINVVMGLSAKNLDAFSDGLFKVAKDTASSFKIAADAATEYARQGLSVEESLKRTKDALILTRLTGMDSAEAVKSLTAAMNTYGHQIKDTTQLVSKFAAVDVQFAVSAEDFADAISRTGAAAKGAGVDIDELIGIVTAAQQQTARGGKVIGNSLKTIFTRVGRTDTLNQLENLGIAVRDVEGKTLGAKRILTDLANTFDSLSEAQKAQIAQTVGGVFQINVLKAILGDAAKQNGILANATQISASATDEAIDKNKELNKTISALVSQTGTSIIEMSSKLGEITLGPGMEKILNAVKSMAEGINTMLGDGESTGNKFATGLLKGIGNIITGPGLVVLTTVFFKLFGQAFKFTRDSLSSLIGITTEAQKQKAIQASLVSLFGQNAALSKEMLRTDISRTEKEKMILGLLKAQVAEANALNAISKQAAATLYTKGYGPNLTPKRRRAYGHIPNFAHPEREQAARGGYAAGNIRSMNMPGEGPIIYNSAETVKNFKGMTQPAIMPPQSSKAGKNYQQAFGSIHGFDPYAAKGYIPNYAKLSATEATKMIKEGKNPQGWNARTDLEDEIMEKARANALKAKNNKGKTKVSNSSDVATDGYLNPNSLNYIGLSASLGPDSPKQTYYVAGGAGTDSGIYASATAAGFQNARKNGKYGAKIDVEFKALDSSDKQKAYGRLDDKMNSSLQAESKVVADKILGRLGRPPIKKDDLNTDLPHSKMAVVSGHIFEAVTKTVLRQLGAEGAISDKSNELIDLGPNQELYELFGIEKGEVKGKDGAEVKINTAAKNVKSLARKIYSLHTGSHLKTKGKTKAYGFIPNFADPLSDAIGREKAAGVPVSQIRVGSHNALMSKGNPLGLGVTNTKDEPNGLRDVFGANGFVPNYAFQQSDFNPRDTTGQFRSTAKLVGKANKHLSALIDTYKKGKISHEQLIKGSNNLNQKYSLSASAHLDMSNRLNDMKRPMDKMKHGFSSMNKKFGKSKPGKMLGSTGGQMGLMMGLPMAGGFIEENVGGRAGSAIGGMLTGAGSGAAMGMMFGPLGMAIGGAVGALGGLVSGLNEAEEAARKESKARIEYAGGLGSQAAAAFGQTPAVQGILSRNTPGIETFESNLATAKKGKTAKRFAKLKSELVDAAQGKLAGKARSSMSEILDALPKGMVFEAEEILSEKERTLLGKDYKPKTRKFTPEEYKKEIQDLGDEEAAKYYKNFVDTVEDSTKVAEERKKSIIIQLNLQRAMITAQKASANAQLEIKSKFLDQVNLLDSQEKLLGGLISEEQKVRIKYNKSLLKASEAYEAGAEEAAKTYKTGLIQDITSKPAVQQELKKELFGGEAGDKTMVDVTGKLAKMNAKELEAILLKIGKTQQEANEIVSNRNLLYENAIDTLKKQEQLTNKQSQLERDLNMKLTERKTLMENINREMDSYVSNLDYASKLRGISSELQAARFGAGPARTQQEIFAEQQRLVGERQQNIQSEYIKSALSTTKSFADKVGLSEEQRMQIIQDPSKLSEISATAISAQEEVLKSKAGYDPSLYIKKLTEDTTKRQEQLTEFSTRPEADQKTDKKQYEEAQKTQKKELEELQLLKTLQQSINDAKAEQTKESKKITEELERQVGLKDAQISKEEKLQRIREKEYARKTGPGAFGEGMKDARIEMGKQVKMMNYELGQNIPRNFADGLASAMTDALNGAKDLDDALTDAAINFLGAIQQALMQQAAYSIVGGLGFNMNPRSRGGNIRNYSRGGGVPAMVTNGEYVMNRNAVNKYGGAFMHSLNAGGKLPGFSNGGSTMGLAQAFGQPINPAPRGIKQTSLAEAFAPRPEYSMMPQRTMGQRMTSFLDDENNMRLYQQEFKKAQAAASFKKTPSSGLAAFFEGSPQSPMSKPNPLSETGSKAALGQSGFIDNLFGGLFKMIFAPFKAIGSMLGMGKYYGGSIRGFADGGAVPGSAVSAGFGGGKHVVSGRAYQSKPMSGYFYSGQAGSVALQEDESALMGVLAAEEKKRQEALAKKAKRRALLQQVIGTVANVGINYAMQGINLGGADSTPLSGDQGGGATITPVSEGGSGVMRHALDLDDATLARFNMSGLSGRLKGPRRFGVNNNYLGGKINKYASGGHISGKSGIDQIPAMLSEGEYVIRASSARQLGKPMLDMINAGKFNEGGPVTPMQESSDSGISGGNTNNINISINMERGKSSEEKSSDSDVGTNPAEKSEEQQNSSQLAERIKAQVVSVIVEEQRPGGLLSGKS
jgi:TP901 family phage tail tape measure protein